MTPLLPLLPLLTLLAALLLVLPGLRRVVFLAGAFPAGVLAVALALGAGPDPVHLDWLLLGSAFGLDPVGRAVLGLAGVLWPLAALTSLPLLGGSHGRRYGICFLLTMSGNLGLLVSQDVAGFYCWFALMTFAACGLVLHDGSDEARRAGRVYLVLAIIGELLLLAGLFSVAAQAGNPAMAELPAVYAGLDRPALTAGLILAGFAVKMGVVPLHVWLPLAHPAAPVPASAVLSGVILKAGLVGWLRLVPTGALHQVEPGLVLAGLGLAGAYLAALAGCFQQRPKTVLAYSSVSQMGLLTLLVGLLLAGYGPPDALLAAIALFAVHHGLAKGALFLAVPVLKAGNRLAAGLTLIPALSLVGVPLTSGVLAKAVFKDAVPEALVFWVTLSSVTTGLILLRFLVLAWPRGPDRHLPEPSVLLGWSGALLASLLVPWLLADGRWLGYTLQFGSLLDGLWPLAAALALALAAARWTGRWPLLPEGDLVLPAERGVNALRRQIRRLLPLSDAEREAPRWPEERRPLAEPGLGLAVLLMLGLTLILAWLSVSG
ncbi:MAG: NADH/ubiquinone/plastoquinone (complex I) [Ectothiorhodospiraceae bacterium]|nr:NADH/ubiquinone/plastoquinone (complex I) [Ectothiorhodospiraceae bacterium]